VIAADTSTWIAFLQGEPGADTDLLAQSLRDKQVVMVPSVLTELLSDPKLGPEVAALLRDIPQIDIEPGYWERAALLRAEVLRKKRKARLGDALIAQACLDRGIVLITRDNDFKAFAGAAGRPLLA